MEGNKVIKKAIISKKDCVACGTCARVCPKEAISIEDGKYAIVNHDLCIGCRTCVKACPAMAISIEGEKNVKKIKTKHWNDYLWIASLTYLILGLFNIGFAWLGLICFFVPLLIAIFGGSKLYCNKYCGRGQLLSLVGNKYKLSLQEDTPKFLRSKWFRYGFLIFFLTMFINMIFTTYLVLIEAKELNKVITIFWTFKVPWEFAYNGGASNWIYQFAFGFYSIMLTSTIIGLIVMILYRPRTWCTFCPMGTMTQLICKLKKRNNIDNESKIIDSNDSVL